MSRHRGRLDSRCKRIAAPALAVALATVVPTLAFAQEASAGPPVRPVEVKAIGGFSTFIDDDFIEHVVAGGSVRIGLTRRWSIEPQFLYMRGGADDQDFYALVNLIYDLETRGRVTPYLIIGGGPFWHRARFGRDGEQVFTSRNWHLGGGAGARIRLSERWAITPEARLGFEPLFQVHAAIGYTF